MRLAGKVALVTGAQQGIGAAIGRALAAEGADVALSWLDDQAGAEAVANYARQAGRRAHPIKADVARLADIEGMVAETVRVLGGLDILVNNAGVYPRVKFLEMRESDWVRLDINLKAGCFAAVASPRRDRGRQGRLESNVVTEIAARGASIQCEQSGWCRLPAPWRSTRATHIRVNAIDTATTPRHRPAAYTAKPERTMIEIAKAAIPLGGKLLAPDQIARSAVFLASDEADAITGQVLHVNGGSYMP